MMHFRLKTQYTIIIVATIIVNVLILSTVLLYQFRTSTLNIAIEGAESVAADLTAQLKERTVETTTAIGVSLVDPLFLYHFDQIQLILENTLKEPDVIEAIVYDVSGHVLHDGSRTMRTTGNPSRDTELAAESVKTRRLISKAVENELRVAYPIYKEHEALGGLLVTYSLAKVHAEAAETERRIAAIGSQGLRQNTYTLAIMTVILVVLGGALAMMVAERLIRPMQHLVTYAKQIGLGIYDFTLDIPRHDELGDLAKALEEMRDNLRRTHDEVHFLAYHDRLTGLPNRAMFKEHLERAIGEALRKGHLLALLFIDIDNFKRINDTFGHPAGDTLLKTLAMRIDECLRPLDFVTMPGKGAEDSTAARLGGDEFIALVPLTRSPLDAAGMARRIIKQVAEPIVIDGKEIHISASIGIAIYPNDGATPNELVTHADLAMYQAKSEGKNTYKYYTEEMNERVRRNMEVELELRQAIGNNELVVYYQPKVDMGTGKIIGAEALVRWQHPKRGMVPPDEFIPIAEETGLILPLGEFVLRESVRQAMIMRHAGHPTFHIAVNVSSIQFRRQDLENLIRNILHENHAPTDVLHIELTESNLMTVEDQAKEQLDKVRALGLPIWIDDFGTGYSSLSYLQRFAIDGVKIDRSFVRDMSESKKDRSLARAIIAMAQSMDLHVIAEGVETREQETILKTCGCRFAQGYLYSKAIPAAEFEQLLGAGIMTKTG